MTHLPQDAALAVAHPPIINPHTHLHSRLVRKLPPIPPAGFPRLMLRLVSPDYKGPAEGEVRDVIAGVVVRSRSRPPLGQDLDPFEPAAAELRGAAGPGPHRHSGEPGRVPEEAVVSYIRDLLGRDAPSCDAALCALIQEFRCLIKYAGLQVDNVSALSTQHKSLEEAT